MLQFAAWGAAMRGGEMRWIIFIILAASVAACRPPKPPSEEMAEVKRYHEPLPEEVQAAASPALAALFETDGYRLYRFHRNMHHELAASIHTKGLADRFACEAAEQLDEFLRAGDEMLGRAEIATRTRLVKLTGPEAERLRVYLQEKQTERQRHGADCTKAAQADVPPTVPTPSSSRKRK